MNNKFIKMSKLKLNLYQIKVGLNKKTFYIIADSLEDALIRANKKYLDVYAIELIAEDVA